MLDYAHIKNNTPKNNVKFSVSLTHKHPHYTQQKEKFLFYIYLYCKIECQSLKFILVVCMVFGKKYKKGKSV